MVLETERLILRAWKIADADELFKYAKDERVGPIAGWPAHKNLEESRLVIQNIFCKPQSYAIVLKQTNLPIGSIGLKFGLESEIINKIADDECELGYWLGVDYWGMGIMPEAARKLIGYAFESLGVEKIWCGYYDGNERSKRVQEKLGFKFHHTTPKVKVLQMHEFRKGHVNLLTKQMWLMND